MDLMEQPLGAEGSLKVKIEGGKLIIEAKHNHASGDIVLSVSEDAGYFFDALANAIPGVIDDAILGIIKESVKKL